jgi:glycosyltransferase involved in cell wall biosynthesis
MGISVCMATYNGEKYIKEQLDSILSQLGDDDEVIISDDGSIDGTLDVISNIKDNRIKVFRNKNEKGYSKNFENALKKAKGDIIFISDQDDVWLKDKVKIMLKTLENSSISIHNARIVDGELNFLNESHFDLHNVKKGFLNNFLKTRYIGACMAFKKEVLQKSLPFPNNQKLCAYDYWITLISEFYFKVELVQEPLIKYRRHGNNASTGGEFSSNTLLFKFKVRLYSLYQLLRR